ncbi:MAG TPA: RNA polymerase subunit sigma-24 [Acidobacteria bacterium]|nr:RNA polymerase subunit sigma-24 [Acidobacteriota bacterium]
MKTDAELVAEALGGAEEAFREIVVRFERPVYSLIARMLQDPATAEDLAQEVFVKAFRRLDTYDPSRKLASWLFKIAHNTTIDHLRRHTPETIPLETGKDPGEEHRGGLAAVLADDSLESPSSAAERRDMARSLERAIARLRPDYREVVVLFYIEGASYQEICEATDLPLGTVKTNLHRARKELAEEMTRLGWGRGETRSASGS